MNLGNQDLVTYVSFSSDSPARLGVSSSLILKGKDDYGGSISGGGPEVVPKVHDFVV